MLQRDLGLPGEKRESALRVFETSPEADLVVKEVLNGIETDACDTGYEGFLDRLHDTIWCDRETGVRSAILTDPKQCNSDTDAIIIPGPFATKLESFIVLAEMIRRLGDVANVRDEKGRVLPVVALSAPVADATIKLNRQQQSQVKAGDFRPIAEKQLESIGKFMPDLHRVSILGVSFGGSMAPVLANVASRSGKQVDTLVMGVPGNMLKQRALKELVSAFADEARAVDPYLAARTGVFSKPQIAGFMDMAKRAGINLDLMRGFAAGQFFGNLADYLHRHPGSNSHLFFTDGDRISPTDVAEQYIGALGINAEKLATPERHGVVYSELVLARAVLKAFRARAV